MLVTGVQTCALPILLLPVPAPFRCHDVVCVLSVACFPDARFRAAVVSRFRPTSVPDVSIPAPCLRSAVKPDPGAVKSKDREPAKCYASVKLPRSTPTTRRRVLQPDDRRSANDFFHDDREWRYDKDCFHDDRA